MVVVVIHVIGKIHQILKKNRARRLLESDRTDPGDQELHPDFQDTLQPFNSIFSMMIDNFHCTFSLVP